MNIKLYAYDIENYTINNRIVPFCVSLGCDEQIKSFFSDDCVKESLSFLDDIGGDLIIYIHNINYDGYIIIGEFDSSLFTLSILLVNNRIYNMKLKSKRTTIEFRCSHQLFPVSLKSFGDQHQFKKMDFPYKILNKKINDDYVIRKKDVCDDKWVEGVCFKEYAIMYCENDVKLTIDLVKFYWNTLKILGIEREMYIKNFTNASIAINYFYNKKNTCNIKKKISVSLDNYIRKSYYGGRCEVYGNKFDDENIFHYDFPGMYASIMLKKFPIGVGYFTNDKKIKRGFHYIKWFLNPNLNILPILPIKCQKSSKLMFYSGYGEGLYWYEEINLHLEFGGEIVEIVSSYCFDDEGYVFKDFVEGTWEIRNMGGLKKTIGKIFANSIYGRMGMGGDYEVGKVITDVDKIYEKIININGISIGFEKGRDKRVIGNVIYSSIICSKARIKLYKAQCDFLKNDCRLLYSDTDSIFFSYKKSLPFKKIIGNIELDENCELLDAVFAQPKTYAIRKKDGDEIIKIKGFNNHTCSFFDFKSKFYIGESVTTFDSFQINKSNLTLIINNNVRKETNLSYYDKRKWDEEKKKTYSIINPNM